MNRLLPGFLRDDRGATAIEYGLIASLVVVVVLGSVVLLGERTGGMYERVRSTIVGALEGGPPDDPSTGEGG